MVASAQPVGNPGRRTDARLQFGALTMSFVACVPGDDVDQVEDIALLHHERAIHIGFPCAEAGVEQDAERRALVRQAHHHRRAIRRRLAEAVGFAVREDEGEFAVFDQRIEKLVKRPHSCRS